MDEWESTYYVRSFFIYYFAKQIIFKNAPSKQSYRIW